MNRRRRMFVGLGVATLVGLGGAGTAGASSVPHGSAPDGSESSSSDGGEVYVPDRAEIEFQVDMMLGLVPNDEMEQYYRDIERERQRGLVQCMQEAGFEYEPSDGQMSFGFDQNTIEWAEQYGFGYFTTMDPDNQPAEWSMAYEDPNQEYLDSLSQSEMEAYWGTQNRCYETSGPASEGVWMNSDLQQQMTDFYQRVETDPRMVAAYEAWVTCMQDAGFSFASQNAMWEEWNTEERNEQMNQFWQSEAWKATSPDHAEWQELVDEEIAMAVANAQCGEPLTESIEEVNRSLRAELIDLWSTIDWYAPPVTYEDPFEDWNYDGTRVVDGTEGSEPAGSENPRDPNATVPASAIDLSGVNTND